jgi:hypothetical protein
MAVLLKERPIFIAGHERSGTTMVMYMLGAHPRIAVPEVTWYYPRFRPHLYTYGDLGQEKNFRTLAEEMVFGLMLPFFGRTVNPRTIMEEILAHCPERSFAGLFAAVLGWYAAGEGKPRWGEKCPYNVFHVPSILEDFPNAQFVYVTRDGRDSAATYLDSSFGPTNILVAAELWRRFGISARRRRAELSTSQWLDVQYETLVREPEATLRRVCEFLGEEYSPAMLEFYKGPFAQRRGRMRDHAPIGGPVTDKLVGIYREMLSLWQQRVFVSVAGEELREYGYPVDVDPLPVSADEAARLRQLDQRTRAARFDLGERFARLYASYNDWLLDQREERRRAGVWSEADRPRGQHPDELLRLSEIQEEKYWKAEFGIKRAYY